MPDVKTNYFIAAGESIHFVLGPGDYQRHANLYTYIRYTNIQTMTEKLTMLYLAIKLSKLWYPMYRYITRAILFTSGNLISWLL